MHFLAIPLIIIYEDTLTFGRSYLHFQRIVLIRLKMRNKQLNMKLSTHFQVRHSKIVIALPNYPIPQYINSPRNILREFCRNITKIMKS